MIWLLIEKRENEQKKKAWTKKIRHEHDLENDELRIRLWVFWRSKPADTLGRLEFWLAFFRFSFFLFLHTILWIWISSTTRDVVHKAYLGHHTFFEISLYSFLFSSLAWLRVGNTDPTGRTVPCQRTLIYKKKKKGKKRLTILLSLPISFASFNFDYDHANANSTFDTWWLSHFQQFNMMHEHILACFDLFWRDLMGYEDGNDLIDLYEWSTKWCCYLADVAVCKCLSERATLISLNCYHCLCSIDSKRFDWFLILFIWLSFLFFFSVLAWLLCIIYCILSKLSMYLIEFTSRLLLLLQLKHRYLFFSPYTVFCCFTLLT